MKKLVALVLVLGLLLSACPGFALNYTQRFTNDPTFETLEEARISAVDFLQDSIPDRLYMQDPALDAYPAGTTYVYRSTNMYRCVSAAFRMNTNFLVYTDESFEDKDAAFAYLKNLGLIDLAEEAMKTIGVTPVIKPIRGGTDGARLSFEGLPCPNIFAGGENFHSRYEYLPIKSLEAAKDVVLEIVKMVASQR